MGLKLEVAKNYCYLWTLMSASTIGGGLFTYLEKSLHRL